PTLTSPQRAADGAGHEQHRPVSDQPFAEHPSGVFETDGTARCVKKSWPSQQAGRDSLQTTNDFNIPKWDILVSMLLACSRYFSGRGVRIWQALATRRALRTRHAFACLLLGWTLAGSQYIDWERLDSVVLARIWYFAALDS